MAGPFDFVDANLFNVESCGVAISFSRSSITGDPRFSYTDKDQSLSFAGGDIRIESTEIGDLVTVTIETVPDLKTVTVTLLVPTVNLPQFGTEENFETVVIFTTHRTSIAGPCGVEGQLKTYKCLDIEGTAQNVVF